MNNLTVLVLLVLPNVSLINGAKILGVIPIPSYSHQIVYRPLWKELSLRGHHVTVLTTDPLNDPSLTNLTEIDLHFTYKTWNKNLLDIINNQENFSKMIEITALTLNEVIDQQLFHPEVRKLIKNESEHFDLLIVEYLMPTMVAFSERFKCPMIGVTSLDAPAVYFELLGSPAHPVLNPDFNLPFVGKLSFKERLTSVLCIVLGKLGNGHFLDDIDRSVKKHFGNHYPFVADIQKNISMLFVNTDPIFHAVRPLVPTVIQIGGGTHRETFKPLPKDLQMHLDNATQGFIYFSLGSNVKSKDLIEKTRNVILETFAELPYKVLWKFELEDLPRKPDNVMTAKWFPQQDIFKHPNIKLFITQGGLQSIDEATYDHVPMVGMPFFMDQPNNIKRMVHNGLGLSVDHKYLDKETFKKTILEVINNPKYRNRMVELATLAKDQPMTGLEKAVWWTEYVIRHKGARHLRSPSLDIPAYQYFLLDVIGFCLLVVAVALYIIVKLVKLIYRIVKWLLGKPKVKTQ